MAWKGQRAAEERRRMPGDPPLVGAAHLVGHQVDLIELADGGGVVKRMRTHRRGEQWPRRDGRDRVVELPHHRPAHPPTISDLPPSPLPPPPFLPLGPPPLY